MNRIEYRQVIKYLFLKNKTIDELNTELNNVNEVSASSSSASKILNVIERSFLTMSVPVVQKTSPMVDIILKTVLDDPILKVRETTETNGI